MITETSSVLLLISAICSTLTSTAFVCYAITCGYGVSTTATATGAGATGARATGAVATGAGVTGVAAATTSAG